MSKEKYILVLTGKTGVGKSALGNAILGEEKFHSSDSGTSVTTKCSLESANRSDLNITVIDTPGFMDTGEDANGAKLKAVKEMKDLMVICPTDGKLAVIFVIKYGERNTEENKITLQILQSIFGREHIWKSCIIVMTMGEMFDLNYATKKSFKQYMQDETGELGELFKMCNYKCVLFYNKTKDEKQKTEQFNTLIQYVKELDQGYTTSKFKDAQREQNRLELESKLSNYEKEFQQKIEQIKEILDKLNLTSESLDELTKINDTINQNLEMVDGIDTPNKIYYESGETRLLDKIRKSFENLNQLILKQKEIVQQLRIKDELEVKINVIVENIKKTNLQDKEINVVIVAFEEDLANMENTIMEGTLKKEHCDYINVKLKNCRQEFELLKLKVQQQKENEMQSYTQQLTQRLNTIEIGDTKSHELFSTLKVEFTAFKCKFEEQHPYMSEEFFQKLKLILNTIQNDILKRDETISQWDQAYKIRKGIIEIEKQIKCTQPNDLEITKKLSNFEKEINDISSKFQESKLRKDFKDNLLLLANSAQQALKELKESVKKKKENEINSVVNNITERLKAVKIDEKNVTEILNNINDERRSVKGILEKENNEINTIFADNMSRILETIKDHIDDKREAVRQSMLSEEHKVKIDNLIKEISETNLKDETIHSKVNELEKKIKSVKLEIKELHLSNEFTPNLEVAMQNATDAMQSLKKSVNANKEREINYQIKNIIIRIKEMHLNNPCYKNELNSLKKDLEDVNKVLMENKDLISKHRFYIMNSSILKANQDISNLEYTYEQFVLAKVLETEINDLTLTIIDTSQTDANAYTRITENEILLNTLQIKSNKFSFDDRLKEILTAAISKARESIKKWREQVQEGKQKKFNYKIQYFREQLSNIKESNVNVVNTLNEIKEEVLKFEIEVKNENQINEDVKDIHLGQVKNVLRKIDEIIENVRQSTEADIIIKDLISLISDIVHTDPRSDNIIKDLSDFINRFSEIDRKVTTIRDQTYLNPIKIKRDHAQEKLNILKKQTKSADSEDIRKLSEQLNTIDPQKKRCCSMFVEMDFKFEKMDKRFQQSNDLFNKCKARYNDLKDRANKYIPMHSKLENIITELKNLPKATWVSTYKKYREQAQELKKEVNIKVTNKNDRDVLEEYINKLIKLTEDKKVRNDWSIAGKVFSFFPFFGDALEEMLTDGNSEQERRQLEQFATL